MTVAQAIQLATALRPHELDRQVLERWLDELEGSLAILVRGEGVQRCTCLPVTRDELRVPAPFDRVYWTYLVAMLDLASGHSADYAHSYALFEETRNAYARWYQSHGRETV